MVAIPVIDLDDFPSQSGELVEACRKWGCFRVINHNIPESLMLSEMKRVVQSFFDRPEEIKRRNAGGPPGSGYMPMNSDYPIYEALGLYDIGAGDVVDTFCSQLDATTHEREVFKAYAMKLLDLGTEIGRKIEESMGLNNMIKSGGGGKSTTLLKGWTCQLRLNKYHFTEKTTVGSLGVPAHTDPGFLTILQEDDAVGGLQVMDPDVAGNFVDVDPLPGSLLIQLGDVAEVWSNGRFRNVMHRVECKEAATRFSVVMFVLGPPEGELIQAPPELVESDGRRLYRPFRYEEMRELRLSTKYRAGDALSLFFAHDHREQAINPAPLPDGAI